MSPCSRFLFHLEEFLEGTLDRTALRFSEEHLARCAACREAVEDSRSAGSLLRAGVSPVQLPDRGFPLCVTAAIRAAEDSRLAAARLFWAPLEHFAARMALVAGLASALLGALVIHDSISIPAAAGDFPDVAAARDFSLESPSVPPDRDSVLRTITEGGYGK
jgi:anti-sigma factor RsiW